MFIHTYTHTHRHTQTHTHTRSLKQASERQHKPSIKNMINGVEGWLHRPALGPAVPVQLLSPNTPWQTQLVPLIIWTPPNKGTQTLSEPLGSFFLTAFVTE